MTTKKELLSELQALRRQLAALQQERDDLALLLETTTDHSDAIEDELHDRAQAALRRSEQQLRMIVDATPVPVSISRVADGQIVYANAMAGPLLGLPPEALLGRPATDFYYAPEERNKVLLLLQQERRVDRYELRLKRADGTPFWAEMSLRWLNFDEQPSLLIAVHDVTERKQTAEALQAAVDDLTRVNRASSCFVPAAFLDFLDKKSIVDIHLGDHVSKEMTVMFSDLRGFTALSESMSAQENFDFINAYFKRTSPVIREHSGFIVKYLGDGMMAIFPKRADDALRAGIEKLRRVAEFNRQRQRDGRPPVRVGIGVNTGHMMAGIVGERDRMEGDVISDEVNLTARVEALTKFYGVSFIITAASYQRLEIPDDYHIRFLDRVQVMGRAEALELYEVYDGDPEELCELKRATLADFDEALQLYYARRFAAAQATLFGVLQRNPQDKVAWHHLVQATQALESGVAENWTGVTVMTTK